LQLLRDLNDLAEQFRRGAVSVGNFDGPHLGHVRIIERLLAMARRVQGPAVVFSFDPHPSRILRPKAAPAPLCWTDRKAELLAELGVDVVVAYPTDAAFLRLESRQFFDRIICQQLDARAVVEGSNFFFGRNRSGNIKVLRQFCAAAGVLLEVVDPVEIDGQVVSSSRVRDLVSAGQLAEARRLLTRPYRIRGTVVRGAGRGAKLGYPTANIADVDTLLPGCGIYAGRAFADGSTWPAAISLGPNPTFDEGNVKVEAHLIGYQGWLYDRTVEVDFLARLRDIKRFDSVAGLVAQMERDVSEVRRIVEG